MKVGVFSDHDRRSLRSHAAKDDEAMQLPASFKWSVVMRLTIGTSQRERGRSEILKIMTHQLTSTARFFLCQFPDRFEALNYDVPSREELEQQQIQLLEVSENRC